MKSKDYFRAISVYKELLFFSKDKDSSANYLYQIGKSYQKSRKYESSIFTYSDLMNSYKLSNTLRNNIEISLGLSYLQWGYLQYAQLLLNRAEIKDNKKISSLYLGLLDIKAENYKYAHKRFNMIESESHDTSLKFIAGKCNNLLSKSDNLNYRNPVFAALLSAVIPGSGQLYSKHYFDAFQAFVFVGASAFATFAVYKYDQNYSSNYLLTILSALVTSFFYSANIYGAYKTADYYNMKRKELYIKEFEKIVFSYDF